MYTKLNKYLLNFFSKEFNFKSDYIFPYQRFFLIEFKVKKKNFFLKISTNLKFLKIYFYKNEANDKEFVEKIYFSNDGQFFIEENFDESFKFISVENVASASDFNIFINFYINRIYSCKISSNEHILPKNQIKNDYAFLIPSFPKTGTTSLIHSLGKNFVPVVKLNYLKLNPKFENTNNHLSIHQNQNLNNKKFIKNYSEIEEPDGDINIFCDYLYFNKYKNSFKHKIYLTVFRDFRTLITSYYFQFNGEKYFSNSYERNQIKLEILKEINKFILFYEKWLENFVNDYNLDFNLLKKIDNAYLLNKSNEKFYFINLNNLETFYKDNLVKEYSISNDFINENLSENKNYSKLYEDVKNDIFAELKNYNFEKFKYVNTIQKMFFNKI